MSTQSISQSYPIFTDIDGQPLENGYIYIGTAGLPAATNQITVYWDAALTTPATQPIRTTGGYPMNSGSPGVIYTGADDFSIAINNKNNSAITSALNVVDRISGGSVTYKTALAGGVIRTLSSKLGDVVSVMDFGAVGDNVTDDTAAFVAALDVATRVYVPAGEYRITGISMPNKQTYFYGDGYYQSIIHTTDAIGIDYQPVGTNNGARYSQINGLRIHAAPGTTALRNNVLGLHITDCFFFGGAIGVETNSSVLSKWENVVSYGSTIGAKFCDPQPAEEWGQSVVWACSFLNVATSGNSPSDGATGVYCSSAISGFMRNCSFINLDMEYTSIGFDFVGDSVTNCIFSNAWIESASSYYGREGVGCANIWNNINTVPTPSAPPNGLSLSVGSVQNTTSAFFPTETGGLRVGISSEVGVNDFRPLGADVVGNIIASKEIGFYPANVASREVSQLVKQQSVTQTATGTNIANSTTVCTVTLSEAGSGFIEFELSYSVNSAVHGGLKYKRFFNWNGSSWVFATVDTDYFNSYADISFNSIDSTSFELIYTWTTTQPVRIGMKACVDCLSGATGSYGAEISFA